jgi:O-methyltransferase
MENRFKRYVPRRLRRTYRRYVSPIVRDSYYRDNTSRKEFFRCAFSALAFNGIDGDYAEFGCCGGVTFGLAFRQSRKSNYFCKLWAFDSFKGLPSKVTEKDDHPMWVEGTMAIDMQEFIKICNENHIPRSDFTIVPGYFEESLKDTASDNLPQNMSLAYIDCDLYSSAKSVLEFLTQRLKHGMIIAFDDYYCWSASQVSGERKACTEYFGDNEKWLLLPFIKYGWGGMSFVVEDKKLNGATGTFY